MTGKERQAVRRRVHRLFSKWRTNLGLDRWRFYVEYASEPLVLNGRYETNINAMTSVGEWPYMSATITFNVDNIAQMDDHRLEETVIHELLHLFFAPFKGSEDVEELMITQLARSFQMLHSEVIA